MPLAIQCDLHLFTGLARVASAMTMWGWIVVCDGKIVCGILIT